MTKDILISASDHVTKSSSGEYYFNSKKLDLKLEANDEEYNHLVKIETENRLAEIINDFAGEQHENTIILTGAGASIIETDSVIKDDHIIYYSGKTVNQLTEDINEFLEEHGPFSLEDFTREVKYIKETDDYTVDDINIEDLLSKAEAAKEYIPLSDGFYETLEKTEGRIKELCDLTLHQEHPHKQFLRKLTARRNSHNRVKVFTTNYDTLFEQAAQEDEFLVIDGFSYDPLRKFNPFMFNYDFVRRKDDLIIDEPDYVEKVFHLYKLHGSVDWEKSNNNIIKKDNVEKPLMIYPRSNKFEQSYEPPYFEMFSRFQNELRKKNTLLITIGFSFADKHIETIVDNAVKNNPGLKLLIADYSIEQDGFKDFREKAEKGHANIMLLEKDFQEFTELYLKQKAYSDRFFEIQGDQND